MSPWLMPRQHADRRRAPPRQVVHLHRSTRARNGIMLRLDLRKLHTCYRISQCARRERVAGAIADYSVKRRVTGACAPSTTHTATS